MGKRIWIGIGVKFGGTFFIGGADTFSAAVIGVSNDNHFIRYVQVDSLRAGLGLGGGIGTSVFLSNVDVLDGEDGSVSKLLPGSVGELISGLNLAFQIPGVKLKFNKQLIHVLGPLVSEIGTLEKFALAVAKYGAKQIDVQKVRDIASVAINTCLSTAGMRSNDDFTTVIDIPPAGAGWEVGAYLTKSETTVRRFPPQNAPGRYEVSVPSENWYWNFYIDPNGTARWQDKNNPSMYGGGVWQAVENSVIVNWYGESQGWDKFPSSYQAKNVPQAGITRTGGREYKTRIMKFAR